MKDITIKESASMIDALKKLDKTAEKVLFVVNNTNHLLGTITDGDIRRSILKGDELNSKINNVYNKKPFSIEKDSYDIEFVKRLMIEKKIEVIPIVGPGNLLTNYITWDQVFDSSKENLSRSLENIDVVIMAGGKGSRLEPFTKILPKPLIPVGDKTIIEHIIDKFIKYGVRKVHIILNYKGDMIKSYLDNVNLDCAVTYIFEKDFFGTAGSLSLLGEDISDQFILSNCDVIVNADYLDLLEYHKKNVSGLTILSSIQHHRIPYGVVEFANGGIVTSITEKPEYTLPINTGVYVLDKSLLNKIPKSQVYHMTDLIKEIIDNKENVLMYPVNENDFSDIGQWDEYRKTMSMFQI